MPDYSTKAMGYFKQGYNCAQSVLAAFSDKLDINFERAVKVASSFGAGMGRLREVCGAVSGMFMVVGLLYGYDDPANKEAKAAHYKLIQELSSKFKEQNGSIICRELLGLNKGPDTPIPEERTAGYYAKRPCVELVGTAAKIVEELIHNMEVKKLKIAVASENGIVTEHFGHCKEFIIFETENNQITKIEILANPGHKPGFLPNFLADRGVDVIISGGMGGGAVEIFNERSVEVVIGATGDSKTVVEAYLAGQLKSTNSICHEHQHRDA